MKPTDLRINNYLQCQEGNILRVDSISESNITAFLIDRTKYPLKKGWKLEPILLTKELILNKTNFEKLPKPLKKGVQYSYRLDNIDVNISNSGNVYLNYKSVPLFYLHELQNLYHIFTGKELQIQI